MQQKIIRLLCPTDGQAFEFSYAGSIVHIGCPANRVDTVELWVLFDVGDEEHTHVLKAYSTNSRIPDGYEYIGTTGRVQSVVWHLFELVETNTGHITEESTGLAEH